MIARRLLIAAGALLATSGAVQAHGPSRQKVKLSVTLDAPPKKVWGVISDFHSMKWQPLVKSVKGDKGSAVGATRTLTFANGATMDEELDKYSAEKMSYGTFSKRTDVKALPVTNYSSTITVSDAGGGKSTVEWRAAFYRGDPLNDPKPELNDAAAVKGVTTYIQTGLDALKKQVESTH